MHHESQSTPFPVSVYRKEHFNAAHRLHSPLLSDAENKVIFGKCNNPLYHGHNYELLVKVTGFVDPVTGYLMDTKLLSRIIEENVIEKLDHKNLNLEVEELKDTNPTCENIAIVIYDILRAKIKSDLKLKITLYETERNFVEYPGE